MDKKELETKREELEKLIRDSEKYLNEVNEQLKKLETFTPSLSFDAFYYGGNRTKFTLSGGVNNERCYSLTNDFNFAKIANSVFAMVDLANWCNSQFDNDSNYRYEIYYSYYSQKFENSSHSGLSSSIAQFNSSESANLAIKQINSNPELKRIAMIFLGVKDENANL